VRFKGHNSCVWDCKFSPEGHYFISGSHDTTSRLWCINREYPLRIFSGHQSDIECVEFHPNCHYIASGSSDCTVRLWEITSGNMVRLFLGHSSAIQTLCFTKNGQYLAAGALNGLIIVWDIPSGREKIRINAHKCSIRALTFAQNNLKDSTMSLLASGGEDKLVKFWNCDRANENCLVETIESKQTPIYYLKFTSSNFLIASGISENV